MTDDELYHKLMLAKVHDLAMQNCLDPAQFEDGSPLKEEAELQHQALVYVAKLIAK